MTFETFVDVLRWLRTNGYSINLDGSTLRPILKDGEFCGYLLSKPFNYYIQLA